MPHAVPVGRRGRRGERRAAIAQHGRWPIARHELEALREALSCPAPVAPAIGLKPFCVELAQLEEACRAGDRPEALLCRARAAGGGPRPLRARARSARRCPPARSSPSPPTCPAP